MIREQTFQKSEHFAERTVVRDALASELMSLGLSSLEAKAYLALLTRPTMSATELCKETGILDSKIYYVLDGLARKGTVTAQRGTPSLFKAIAPKRAVASLREQINLEFRKKMEHADDLVAKLEPLYERAGGAEIELAYVVKGLRNVIRRMNELIDSSRREVTLLAPDDSLLEASIKSLRHARQRRVAIKLAVPRDRQKADLIEGLGETRVLQSPCSILIVDRKILLTISDWKSDNCYAILTEDPNMTTLAQEYYENPKCCSP